jgi:hypothetical protein
VEVVVEAYPSSVISPLTKVLISSTPMRKVVGHQSPGAASAQDVLDGVDDVSQGVLSKPATGLVRREKRLKNLPLSI